MECDIALGNGDWDAWADSIDKQVSFLTDEHHKLVGTSFLALMEQKASEFEHIKDNLLFDCNNVFLRTSKVDKIAKLCTLRGVHQCKRLCNKRVLKF